MATSTGTATNYRDLLARLITFLTTDGDLVAGGQEWEVLRTVTSGGENDHLLRGPGLDGTQQIHTRLATVNAGANVGISQWGFVSYNSALANNNQPGISPVCGMALRNDTMTYWFWADGRSYAVIAKVSTYYMSLFGGFILPWATSGEDESEYPYPLYVAGSHQSGSAQANNLATEAVGSFWNPAATCAYIRHTDGNWLEVCSHTNVGSFPSTACVTFPYAFNIAQTAHADGSRAFWPVVILKRTSVTNPYGVLPWCEGLQYVVGAEDTAVESGDNYTIFPTVYRADDRSYVAMRMD